MSSPDSSRLASQNLISHGFGSAAADTVNRQDNRSHAQYGVDLHTAFSSLVSYQMFRGTDSDVHLLTAAGYDTFSRYSNQN